MPAACMSVLWPRVSVCAPTAEDCVRKKIRVGRKFAGGGGGGGEVARR